MSLNTRDASSQPAIKGKAGPLPGNYRLLRANHTALLSPGNSPAAGTQRTDCPAAPGDRQRQQS